MEFSGLSNLPTVCRFREKRMGEVRGDEDDPICQNFNIFGLLLFSSPFLPYAAKRDWRTIQKCWLYRLESMSHFTLFLWLRKASAFFGLSDYPTTVTKLISSQLPDQVLSIGGHQIVVVGHRTLLSRQYIEYVMHGHEPHVAAILPLFCCFLEFHCCTGLVQA